VFRQVLVVNAGTVRERDLRDGVQLAVEFRRLPGSRQNERAVNHPLRDLSIVHGLTSTLTGIFRVESNSISATR
jgi:hypothetical protein